jgi:phage terminase large subunit-like protein
MDDDTGSPQIPVVSTTISQSLKACYGVAEAMCRAEQELSSRAIIYTGVSTPRIATPHNGGLLFPLADTVDGLQGLDCSAAVLDEIGFSSMETFSSLMLAGGKRARSLLIGTGTPGLDRDNALFALRERMHSGRPMPGVVWHEYSAPDNCIVTDRAVWRKANPAIEAGFLREDALEQALALVPEAHFRIFRLGQFGIDGVESWLGEDGRAVWNASQFNYDFVPGERTWCGLDVGLKRDSTALVSVQFMPDGRLHAKAKIWLPKSDEPVDLQDIMAEIRKLHETYKVEAIAYDPKMFELAAQELYDEGIKMVEFPQSLQRMQPAVGKLYEQVRNNQVTHPHDEGFTQQVLNAVPRLQDGGFTLSKGKSRGRIDAAVALALAVDRALHKKKARALYVA